MSKIEELAGKLSLALKENLSSNGHSASGRLIQSITSSVAYKDGQIEVTIDAEEYAKYLNDGTNPHFPPVDKILEWVRVKPIMPRQNGKLPTEEQLAYLIGRKISKSGTKATHFIENTLEKGNFVERLEKAIVEELEKQFDDEHIQEIFKD
jgi:hypothetical protein